MSMWMRLRRAVPSLLVSAMVLLSAAARSAGTETVTEVGTVHYAVNYNGSPAIGEATHRFALGAERYWLETRLKTTGLVALFATLDYMQRSEGRLTDAGLLPERFEVTRGGKLREFAEFDRVSGEVRLNRRDKVKTAALAEGTQDVLSLWHQIRLGHQDVPAELLVVTGKVAALSSIAWLQDEILTLPAPLGHVDARHLRVREAAGKLTIDVWFAPAHGMLPVRIRMEDDDGSVLEQSALSIESGVTNP